MEKKLGAQLRRQLIPDLIEYKDFDAEIDNIVKELVEEVNSANYFPSRPMHYLVEKSRGLCRQMTFAHPRDLIILQALSTELYSGIKSSMPTDKAYFEPGEKAFNKKKLSLSTNEYGAIASWKKFQESIFEFSKDRNFVVVTDIANFYDFINFNHMRNIISSICDVKESVLDFLIFVLNEIAWNPDFMPRTEIGLPQMNIDAPRVLSNAMLFELDKIANSHSTGDYVRFMDDIDVGVDTIADAKKVIRDIDLTLQARQLRLNSSKTKILSTVNGDAARHFCIKENAHLDKCTDILESSVDPSAESRTAKKLSKFYKIWRGSDVTEPISRNARFFSGNGEKIFKRVSKLLHVCGQSVPDNDLLWLIKNTPSLRSDAFRYLAHSSPANSNFYELLTLLQSGLFVDHAAYIELANFLVHAKFINNAKFQKHLKILIKHLIGTNNYFAYYAMLMIAIRFLPPQELQKIIIQCEKFWKSDFWFARAVGAAAPVMILDKYVARDHLQLLQKVGNSDALAVYEFHISIKEKLSIVNKLFNYAKSENHTFPQNFYFPKSLIIKSICRNEDSTAKKYVILKKHAILKSDSFYKKWKFV